MAGRVSLLRSSVAQLASPAAKVPSRPLRSVSASSRSTRPMPFLRACDRAVAQHQMREIERPFVRRHVGALGHEAHVAERAGLFDLGVILLLHAVDFAGRTVVDQVEQPREGIAQIEAAPAAVADVEDPLHLRFERLLVPEPRVLPIHGVAGGGFQAAFAHVDAVSLRSAGRKRGPVRVPFAKAARRSGQRVERLLEAAGMALLRLGQRLEPVGDLRSKPSSRAVRAMPGYMSVYSCVSPAIAALRLEPVGPIGRPVAGSPLTSRNRDGRAHGRSRLRRSSGTRRRHRCSLRRRPSGRSRDSGGWPGSRPRRRPSDCPRSWIP